MSRSGKAPATIWGEEEFPLPSVGLLLVMIGLSIMALNMFGNLLDISNFV